MDAVAVIAEFNPLHTGHAYLLSALRRLFGGEAGLIVFLSGAFVQRGEPALFDKWLRARWALAAGADAVIELPAVYALSSAAGFAYGGVTLAARLGCTHLACGTEAGTGADFLSLAHAALTETFPASTAQQPKNSTIGQQQTQQLKERFPQFVPLLQQPNALLAAEYAKVIVQHAKTMDFVTIPRKGAHNSPQPEENIASASFLRQTLAEKQNLSLILPYIPRQNQAALYAAYQRGAYTDYTRYGDFVCLAGRTLSAADLRHLPAFTEGLENRWQTIFQSATAYEEALAQIKTKRYAYSRLRRMGAYTVLQPSRDLMNESYEKGPQYARILGLNQRGAAFLKEAKKHFPMVNKVRKDSRNLTELGKKQLALDLKASDVQALCCKGKAARTGGQDYYNSPVIKDKTRKKQ